MEREQGAARNFCITLKDKKKNYNNDLIMNENNAASQHQKTCSSPFDAAKKSCESCESCESLAAAHYGI